MKNFKLLLCIAALMLAASCAHQASVKVTLDDVTEGEIVVKLLDVNHFEVLDTVKAGASFNVKVAPGDPEFVYLFYGETQIASLILAAGDKVEVKADTLGKFSVVGSPESEKLARVEAEYAEFMREMLAYAAQVEALDEEAAAKLSHVMAKSYVTYYRSRVRYVLENSHSLTAVPVFYQSLGNGVPIFNQATDGVFFGNIADSLATVYPESRYVKALKAEAQRRVEAMELSSKIDAAQQVNYLDIEMPDIQGVKRKLSEVEAKVVLVHFWSATEASQKMFNIEALKPLYEEFHAKGFEIYAVALDSDKLSWARIVKEQGLEWINVCDGLGEASPVVVTYNLSQTPVSFLIADGDISSEKFGSAQELRKVISKLLK